MDLDKYLTILTFIPWIFIFVISTFNNLNNKNYQNFSWKYLKKNFFKIFRLDTLVLIVAFGYFASFDKEFVDKYLFAVMCIYLCVNSFYEKKDSLKKNFFKNNVLNIFLLFLIMLIPFYIYFVKHDLDSTYKIMFLDLFLQYIIILGVSYITKFLKKILKLK